MTDKPTIREPDPIRLDFARQLRTVQVSDHFQAILGCLLGKDSTTPRLIEMVIMPDGIQTRWSRLTLSHIKTSLG